MTAPGWLIARPIAHRGLHNRLEGRIENSASAALTAAAHGFAIECDVQRAACGEAVVFHDFTLDRLTAATGSVSARSAAELGRLPLLGASDTVPALPDFLALVADRVPVIVEVKSRFDGDLRLTRRVEEVARAARCRVAVKSFDPAVVAALAALAPDLPRGVVGQSRYDDPEWAHLSPEARKGLAGLDHAETTRPHFLSWRVADLPVTPLMARRGLAHLPVITWTVRTEAERGRAAAHADQMVFEGFVPDS